MKIKFNTLVTAEILQTSVSANTINDLYKTTEIGSMKGMPTAENYIEYESKVKQLLDSYKSLLLSDCKKMESMVNNVLQNDSEIASILKTAAVNATEKASNKNPGVHDFTAAFKSVGKIK